MLPVVYRVPTAKPNKHWRDLAMTEHVCQLGRTVDSGEAHNPRVVCSGRPTTALAHRNGPHARGKVWPIRPSVPTPAGILTLEAFDASLCRDQKLLRMHTYRGSYKAGHWRHRSILNCDMGHPHC